MRESDEAQAKAHLRRALRELRAALAIVAPHARLDRKFRRINGRLVESDRTMSEALRYPMAEEETNDRTQGRKPASKNPRGNRKGKAGNDPKRGI